MGGPVRGNGWIAAALLVALVALAPVEAQERGWVEVDYGGLVDRRALSHSGESVGTLLQRLGGRALPAPGERAEDRLAHALLDPLLEPYAFVLEDALDALVAAPDPPMIEVGALWAPGEAQPAWAELLRGRRFIVLSDGRGRMRVVLPLEDGEGAAFPSSADASRAAWDRAWPVLRHVFAAERRRLEGQGAGATALRVEAFAYRHDRADTRFTLGLEPHVAEVADTRSDGRRPPLDLGSLEGFLASGLQVEGGRLEADGSLRLLGSRVAVPPAVLGRPLGLADLAVAYRTVFHGGLSEPYMSLDRGFSPQGSIVNYGGRLRDTDLGMVSLLCDIRFKTFSLGLDIATGRDVRAELRGRIPGFMTHLERFAADPASARVQAQQTRLWFYPDDVDLTVSSQGDVLALRKVRMSAASERVAGATLAAEGGDDPPWTRATVAAIDEDYDALAASFPELADLDQVVRLLSLFTWLRQADAAGAGVPDLDGLLALELPASFTPRRFPQLLTFDALPPAGGDGPVAALDRVAVGEALDRLGPRSGDLSARLRFERAVAALDAQNEQEAALLEEFGGYDPGALDESALDVLAYRAERLRMHRLVLSTLDRERAERLVARQRAGEDLRIFSVGIGGLDLGMGQALARAGGRSLGLAAGVSVAGGGSASRGGAQVAGRSAAPARAASREGWRRESPVTGAALPDHGLGAAAARPVVSVRFGDHRLERGVDEAAGADGRPARREWVRAIMGLHDPEVRSRRVDFDARRRAEGFERFEGGRWLGYRLVREGAALRAERGAVPAGGSSRAGIESAAAVPDGLVRLSLADDEPPASPAKRIRLEFAQAGVPRQLEADFPREVLQRLVMGRAVDTAPAQPLPLAPLPASLGAVEAVMFQLGPAGRTPPWDAPRPPGPGEDDPVRLARALDAWSRQGPAAQAAPPAVVGVDPATSAGRWSAAPRPGPGALLLLPRDGFSGAAASIRDGLAAAWKSGPVAEALPSAVGATLVVVASHESPARCSSRLAELASSPALRGKLLAGWCLAGEPRADLPAQLVSEGGIAGLGLASSSLIDLRRAAESLAELDRGLADPAGRRIERIASPFVWFF